MRFHSASLGEKNVFRGQSRAHKKRRSHQDHGNAAGRSKGGSLPSGKKAARGGNLRDGQVLHGKRPFSTTREGKLPLNVSEEKRNT